MLDAMPADLPAPPHVRRRGESALDEEGQVEKSRVFNILSQVQITILTSD